MAGLISRCLTSWEFFFLNFVCLIFCGCSDQKTSITKTKSDLDQYELHGNVRSVRSKSFVFGESKLTSKDSLVEVTGSYLVNFNNEGRITDVIFYSVSGKIQYREIYERDAAGNLMEVVAKDTLDKTLSKSIYKNDSLGRPLEVKVCGADGKGFRKFTNKYDTRGKLVEYKSYMGDSVLNSIVTYKYDIASHTQHQIKTSAYGEINFEMECQTDSMDLVIEEHTTAPNLEGGIHAHYKYVFDSHGNWIEKSSDMHNGDKKLKGLFRKRTITYY